MSASSTGSTPADTQWVTVVVDADADGAASTSVGPTSVNLLTGDNSLSVTDADEFGISLVRTASSRDTDSGYQLQADALTKDQQEGNTVSGVAGSVVASIDTAHHHSGASSFRVPGGTNDSFVAIGGDAGALRLGFKPGRTYRVSGWVYVPKSTPLSPDNARGLSLAVFTHVGTNPWPEPYGTNFSTARPTVQDAWQQVSTDFTIPVGATEAMLRVYSGYNSASSVVYWDDISVNELWSPVGPEWDLGTQDGASGTAYTRITRPYDDVVSLELTGGGQVWFTAGSNGAWWPEPGAESLQLSSVSLTTWRITELDGTITDFVKNTASNDFGVSTTSPPAAAGATRYVYDITTVPGVSRPSRIIAPIEPGVDGWPTNAQACTTAAPARGCEVMDLEYATATSATSATPGTYAGRLSQASVWAWNGTAMVKTPVAAYAYGTDGRLAQVSDPRIVAAGSSAQITNYAYDAAGRLTSVTAPGDAAYRFTYGAAGVTKTGAGDYIDPSPGRLLTVTRAFLQPGAAGFAAGDDNTTTIVYGVPLTRATGGPYDLDSGSIATWAQQDGPTDATAVFGPLDTPSVTSATATAPGPDGYTAATVSYLNASGLEVNTASPVGLNAPVEGYIDTAEYDGRGNVIRTLDATNRLLALNKLPNATAMLAAWGLDTKTPIELAQLLDSRSAYSDDGLDLLVSVGPVQRLAVSNDPNDVRTLRPTTVNTYDQGKPDGAAYHLVTTTTTFGQDLVPATPPSGLPLVTGTQYDPLVTSNGYNPVDGAPALGLTSGWKTGQPTTVTVDVGGPKPLTSTVVYDDRGRAIKSSKPGSTGTDAATTLSVFYTAGANAADAACGNKPEWAGQPCTTAAAGAITGLDAARMDASLPVKRVEAYNGFGSPTVVSDYVGTVKRTATTTYDAADRVTAVELTGTAGTGSAVSKVATAYDPVMGEVVSNTPLKADGTPDTAHAITKTYDKLGRLTEYNDGTGGWTRTKYDRLGQPLAVTDSIGTTRTYTYDRAVEPRGFVTQMTDSVAGAITPTWGADGQLESETLPGGVTLTLTYDTARVPTARTYTRASDGVVIQSDSVVENQRGQWIQHTSNTGVQTYTYDRLGRLTGVNDTSAATNQCTNRTYGFDNHTNRTSFSTVTAAAACPTSGGSTVTSTYDTADRLVSTTGTNGSAWTYDKLGRITAMPTPDGTKVAATGYFVNDLVASQEVPGVTKSTWTLDPLQRFSSENTSAWVNNAWANSTEQVSHYDGDDDEPAWIVEDTTLPDNISRYIEGMDGAVAVQTGKTGSRVLQLVDLHGDVTATLPIADGDTAATWSSLQFTSFDESGNPKPMTSGQTGTAPPRYGWLGAAQRSADTPAGVILMGVRLYSPSIGRFLQVDPVPGGSASAYDYCSADPVNCTDLAGTFSFKGLVKAIAVVGEIASWIPGPIGAAAAGVSAIAYVASGNKGKALEMAVTAAANLVGAGAGVRAGVKVAELAAKAGAKVKAVAKVARACNSFVPGTLVVMADGTRRPIEDVGEGDLILSGDPETGEVSTEPVIGPIVGQGTKHLIKLDVDGSATPIIATANHPIWVAGQGWVDAQDVRVGDHLRTASSRAPPVVGIEDLGKVDDQTVFNLHVAGPHTYFVAATDDSEGYLVHNASCFNLPRAQGVYHIVFNDGREYVGRSANMQRRVTQHFMTGGKLNKIGAANVKSISTAQFNHAHEAREWEDALIRSRASRLGGLGSKLINRRFEIRAW